MNYRHIYHAGNFADVLKHSILISLVNQLLLKDKPFAVLDSFAGIGIYDLKSEEASKTLESSNGISQLISKIGENTPNIISQYIDIIQSYNHPKELIQHYPGSPFIIANMLREYDKLIACELHKEDYISLKMNCSDNPLIKVHLIDAYNSVKAFWPPLEGRGLILLDPPFEVTNEFDKILTALSLIKKRSHSTTTMLWYPIKDTKVINDFYTRYKAIGYKETIVIEFAIKLASINKPNAMHKCGILISNPSNVYNQIEELLKYLTNNVYIDNDASYSLKLI